MQHILHTLEIPRYVFDDNYRPNYYMGESDELPISVIQNYPQMRAENILTNKEIFGKFMTKPKTGKIVTLGEI